jgi:hypothetical protein
MARDSYYAEALVAVGFALQINLAQPARDKRLNFHAAQPVRQPAPCPDQHASAPHIAGNPDVIVAGGGAVDAHPAMVGEGALRGFVNSQAWLQA